MRKIGLLSDTHAYWDERFATYFADCDEIWHAGDIGSEELISQFEDLGKQLRFVYGNIDSHNLRNIFPKTALFKCENVKVFITHIGGYPGKYATGIKTELIDCQADLFISGHSHILKVIYDKELKCLHINPGAAGKQGFHKQRTLVRFVIDNKDIKDLEVIELAK